MTNLRHLLLDEIIRDCDLAQQVFNEFDGFLICSPVEGEYPVATGQRGYQVTGSYLVLALARDLNTLIVGRSSSSGIVIDQPHISRTHAAIGNMAGNIYIQDKKSSNRTYVNQDHVPFDRPRFLQNGDKISLGAQPYFLFLNLEGLRNELEPQANAERYLA